MENKRLHITPLTPALLKSYFPSSQPQNVSFHTLQTFPERSYGFVELPEAEALKLRKKLHGTIFKGTKVSVEEARPVKDDQSQSKPVRMRKRKRVEAVELRDRKVKRGWTDVKAEKKNLKSKYTRGPECLFKVKVDHIPSVIHEFSKATKFPTFLKSNKIGSAKTAHYVEEKGWVNEDGDIIEPPRPRRKLAPRKKEVQAEAVEQIEAQETIADAVDSGVGSKPAEAMYDAASLTSEEHYSDVASVSSAVEEQPAGSPTPDLPDEDSTHSSDPEIAQLQATQQLQRSVAAAERESADDTSQADTDSDSASSSQSASEQSVSGPETSLVFPQQADAGSESSSESESEDSSSDEDSSSSSEQSESEELASTIENETEINLQSNAPVSQSANSNSSDADKEKPVLSINTGIHPLEALYKRSNEEVATFTFGGNSDIEDEDDDADVPMTPFTKDITTRELRSGAPTPDTAFANRRFFEEPESPTREAPMSDFQKWFYEHRGEANRAWKSRRRTVAKQKRYRENKRRAGRDE